VGDTLRRPALKSELEAAITSSVRSSDPTCAKFVGAIIAECKKSEVAAGWTVKGVRYGKAPRDKCDAALASVINKLQAQYVLLAEPKIKVEHVARGA
jgi:hypothetical protein